MKPCFVIGCLFLLAGGCSLRGSEVVRNRLAGLPRMTCDQLSRNGPPNDGQVAVTDLLPCDNGFVATRIDGDLDLYVPAYPAKFAQEPRPRDLVFLLQVWSDEDRQLLFKNPRPSEVTCWATHYAKVVTFSRGPGEVEQWVGDGLQVKYPGIQLAKMMVLTFGHGDTPTAERVRSAHQYGIWDIAIAVIFLALSAALGLRRLLWQAPKKFEKPVAKCIDAGVPEGSA